MRIGTWNVEGYPLATSEKGLEIVDFFDGVKADIWLLTEVNAGWQSRHGRLVVSPPRSYGREQDRWAGIQTHLPITRLPDPNGGPANAEEALCLTRVELPPSASAPSVLVACSVLPWRGASQYWPGLPAESFDAQASYVLDHHIRRIHAERRDGEPVIWGGDFNQELRPVTASRAADGFRMAGTKNGIGRLQDAFGKFGLQPLTEDAGHRIEGAWSIDHLAVSASMVEQQQVDLHRLTRRNGKRLSDHAVYVADVAL
ncbi:Endonuclease/exonuclease/phosphatase [Modestobacter italicus]|uniref:Endonuclease/exonuclease/phosphatase n=1 Tax=Modestobacter italicus (strain DSM 44449 / CECT 9708 / BC 501) TaxID=2732864 RepID=I4F1J5_MODI5|nr:endonuclease/exonuclease/phosphatase family protein [Modestobacter marinus]CCH89508.1 Endonuclease/exonuclease/phosphatase [Modestobacter marinus]